ncbi:50S ribosomal protein L5 [Sulfuriroseicoccus oceanibius]|uniref:Large ribosomal subunit protein uL5 n=1 Tax=Sulfuriroseicoccus oceanibius TaxID=2707525 RepID=A0A6B3L6I7_9BACT|nr:50S ribosomal protein L5 [Sulfuriroseicoccus oceanibius]QQL45833.1 50S ribosomal protein L5 [Sulfuriroseicoccus oceanibius]
MSTTLPTLQKEYRERVIPALKEKFNYANVNQIPVIEKVVINSCVGKEADRKAAVEDVIAEIAKITGQQPVPTRAKKSVSNFRLREGDAIGAKVTLRGRTMWEFLERFIRTAMPRIRDFRGVSPKSFDGRGNYGIGINDQSIFPEIELDKIKRQIGFDIIITTSAKTDDEARELLRLVGVPFRKSGGEQAA